jgi:Family of unknown function (DUF6370)
MKKSKLFVILTAVVLAAAFASRALAAGTNEVTLTGMMVCGKCKLHITQTCQNVLQIEKDGKTVNYFLTQNKVSKDFHPNICQNDGEKTTVTGTVKKINGQELLNASKIEPVK